MNVACWHEAADLGCPQFGRYPGGKPDIAQMVGFGRD